MSGASGGKGQSDVYYWDQAWLGRFVNDSIGTDELLAKKHLAYPDYNFADFLPQLVDVTASYRGKKIGVPFDIPIFIMMYRKDIFDQLKLPITTTMTDYLTRSKRSRGEWTGHHGHVGQ